MTAPYQRVSLRFSAGGRYASMLAERDTGGYVPELWTLAAGGDAHVRDRKSVV